MPTCNYQCDYCGYKMSELHSAGTRLAECPKCGRRISDRPALSPEVFRSIQAIESSFDEGMGFVDVARRSRGQSPA